MSYTGRNHFRNERSGNGTDDSGGTYDEQSDHFPVAESDSQPCENPRIYRNYSFICNGGAVTLQAYLPSLNDALGVYIPLIVVNCIILGRAESYAYPNPPIPSLFDGLGMGLGFSLALTCIGAVREILAAGSVFGFRIMPDSYVTINIFGLAPGAFFVLAALTALQNYIKNKRKLAGKDYEKIQSGCGHDCLHCGESGCSERFYDNTDTSEDAVMDAARVAAKPKAATDDLETIDLDKEDK